MFFFLSKILDLLFAPLTWAIALLVVGVWAAYRRRARLALAAPIGALAILCVFSTEPVANAILGSLEASATKTMRDDVTYDAVIVLGGLVDEDANEAWGDRNYAHAVERLHAGFELLRAGRAKYAILSGGVGRAGQRLTEADVLAEQLAEWGIDSDRLVREGTSRNTHENAVECGKIARERSWTRLVVVTSAMHMVRAAGCFRAEGLAFDTLPVDHRSGGARGMSLLPRAGALDASTYSLREHAGRIIYRARGYATAWP
jgi:uncharacterized SAM-binding protein YcdF (DUF218 family)